MTILTENVEIDPQSLGADVVVLQDLFTGVTKGAASASKALVVDASKNLTGLGNIATGWTRPFVDDGAAVTLTAAQSGGLCVFDDTTGALYTLPAPAVGLWYDFVVNTACSSGVQKVITDAGTTFIRGTVLQLVSATPAFTVRAADGSTHLAVSLNGTTTGGLAGTYFRLTCVSATLWEVSNALIISSGTVATPFATS